MKLIRQQISDNMYTEEDYLAIMGRRRVVQEEQPRAERNIAETETTITTACQKKSDLNANRLGGDEMLQQEEIKEEPIETNDQCYENTDMLVDPADCPMRVIGSMVKVESCCLPSGDSIEDGAIDDVALDLSQQRISYEPFYDEALDLSTTRERREYVPVTALDLSTKANPVVVSEESTDSGSPQKKPQVNGILEPGEIPLEPEETNTPKNGSLEEGEIPLEWCEENNSPKKASLEEVEAPVELPEIPFETSEIQSVTKESPAPPSPPEVSENSPPPVETTVTKALVQPINSEDSQTEFVCEICNKPFDNLTELGKHTMVHVKAVKEQQARIKKAEQEQRKSIQLKKKQEKVNQNSTASTPLKEVTVLNTTTQQSLPAYPADKPLKPKAATSVTKKSLQNPIREEQFECHLCKTAFITMRALGVHNRTHPKCKACHKQLADKDALKDHVCPEAEQKQKETAQAKQAKLISWLMNAAKKSPKKAVAAAIPSVSEVPAENPQQEVAEDITNEVQSPKIIVPDAEHQNEVTIEKTKGGKIKNTGKKTVPTKTSKRIKAKADDTDTASTISTDSTKCEKKANEKKERKKTSSSNNVRETTPESDVVSQASTDSDVPRKRRKAATKTQAEVDVPPQATEEAKGNESKIVKKKAKSQSVNSADETAKSADKIVEIDRVSLTSGISESSAADENNPVPKRKRKTQQKIKWIKIETGTDETESEPPSKKKKALKPKGNEDENKDIEITATVEPKKKAQKIKPAAKGSETTTTKALVEIVPSQDASAAKVKPEENEKKKNVGRTTNPRGRPRKNPVQTLTEEDLTCRTCGNSFGNIGLLKNHIKSHRWQNPHICGSCGLVFKGALEVKEHNKIHNANKPFKCNECDSAFTRRFFLELHLRSHTGEKPFHCDLCEKAFAQSSQLKIHKRIHMGDKPNKCTVCGATFVMASKLKDHMRIHSGDRPYSCDQCGKTFAQAYYLKIHLRTHSGAKPFKCSVCGQGFRQSCHVVIHMRTHTKVNPYSCTDCGMTFRHSPVLKKHKENGCTGSKTMVVVKDEASA